MQTASLQHSAEFVLTANLYGGNQFHKATGSREQAGDLGMESTSLDDVLYRYASFRNLVDPITHDLIISLARYIHCPKPACLSKDIQSLPLN
ncbi:UNVERIFIED_CONTAM: Leucine-rich repeat-containing protein 75A [Gekko kuhli]